MLSFLSRYKLYNQIAFLSAIILAIFIFISTAINIQQQQTDMSDELERNANALVRNMSSTLSYLVVTNNLDVIEEALLNAADFPNIILLEVINLNGELLGKVVNENNTTQVIYTNNKDSLPSFLINQDEIVTRYTTDTLAIWFPLKTSSVLGWLNIKISLVKLQKQRQEVIYKNVIGALIAIVLDIFLIIAILKRPTRQLNRAIRIANALHTESPYEVDDTGGSYEISQLIEAMNGAARRIAKQKSEITNKNDTLINNNIMLEGMMQTQSLLLSDHDRETSFYYVMKSTIDFYKVQLAMLIEYTDENFNAQLKLLGFAHTGFSVETCLNITKNNSQLIGQNNLSGILGELVKSKKTIYSDLVESDNFISPLDNWQSEIKTVMAVPLLNNYELNGILLLCNLSDECAKDEIKNSFSPYLSAINNLILNYKSRQKAVQIFDRNQVILNSTSEGICGIDKAGAVMFANPAASHLLGYSEQELMNNNLERLITRKDFYNNSDNVIQWPALLAIETGKVQRINKALFATKKGIDIPVTYTSVPVIENEKITGAVITFMDLSELTRTEVELRLSQERFDRSVNATNDGIWEYDFEKSEIWLSSRLKRLLDIDSNESHLTLEEFYAKINPEDQESVDLYLKNHSADKEGLDVNCRFLLENNEYKWFKLRGSICYSEKGTALYASGSMIDVNDQIRIDKMKDEFISTVSHELRTPLTSIRGALGLLDSGMIGEMDDKVASMVNIAHRNSDQLLALINDILDLAKIESGDIQFYMTDIELLSFLKNNINLNKTYAIEHSISLAIESEINEAWIYSDEARLNQVVSNLLSNAMKFSKPSGRVRIVLSQVNKNYRIAVIDNGPGIDKSYQPYLFKKFTQEQSTLTRSVGGTGLGLSISKGIVEQLGCTLSYTTSKGGSSFFVDIPISEKWTDI